MRQRHEKILQAPIAWLPLVFMGWFLPDLGPNMAQAQLSACTGLSYTHTRCENLRGNLPASDAIRSVGSPEPIGESLTGLPDLSKILPFRHQVPTEPIAEPLMPPIDGARDFLNRRNPAQAILPILPTATPQPGLRVR